MVALKVKLGDKEGNHASSSGQHLYMYKIPPIFVELSSLATSDRPTNRVEVCQNLTELVHWSQV